MFFKFLLIFSLTISFVFCGSAEINVRTNGNYVTIKNGGPIESHIALDNIFKLVDPSNQLMGVATEMILGHHVSNNYPSRVFDIGLGMACLPRYFLHKYPSMEVHGTDMDSRVILKFGEVYREHMAKVIPKSEIDRLTITPNDGEELISNGILKTSNFDVIWLDILDDNYKSKDNLLFKRDFFDVVSS